MPPTDTQAAPQATQDPTQSLSPDIQKTLADPEFLKLPGQSQVEVLDHLHKQAQAATTPPAAMPSTNLTPPPEATTTKIARGATLGALSGLGVPEKIDPAQNDWKNAWDVTSGAVKNAAGGLAQMVTDPLGASLSVGKGLYNAGKEAWTGIHDKDPEQAAHGVGSFLAQAIMLKKAGESAVEGATRGVPDVAKAKGMTAMGTTADTVGSFDKIWPTIVKSAKDSGLDTVGKVRDSVESSSRTLDAKYNNALALIGNVPVDTTSIAARIKNLITPDMAKTPEGRAQIREIQAAARPYDGRTWTNTELNAKRTTENNNLASYYNKDSQGQAASPLQQDISRAVRDGAADLGYQQIDKTNPGFDTKQLKAEQGALWDTRIALEKRLNELRVQQGAFDASGTLGKIKAGASISATGKPHGWFSNLLSATQEGPMDAANANIKSALDMSPTARAARIAKVGGTYAWREAVSALPVAALASDQPTPKTNLTPPPQASQP